MSDGDMDFLNSGNLSRLKCRIFQRFGGCSEVFPTQPHWDFNTQMMGEFS